jgi:TonB-linked SusC/RagA family outer membrane protein
MKRFSIVIIASFLCSCCAMAQTTNTLTKDSLLTVGYATGNANNFAGSIETITRPQMNNKDQLTNPLDAIRGRVAGLTIQRGNNGTAALDAVRLRGTTSLTTGNDPLIIVDGVVGDLSLLESVYPTDIESFTILKDAAETSQYGSRGASGVIEITTVKGSKGKTRVSYNGSFGIASAYKTLNMLDGNAFRSLASERNITILDKKNNTNFQKEIQQTGLQQQHHIAFYGGTDASNYRVALGFMDKQGVIQHEDRRNFTSSMNMTQLLFDGFVKCDLGMFGSIAKDRNLVDLQKTFYSAAAFNPTFPNHKNTESGSWDQITEASQITNPLAWMDVRDHDTNSHISTHARLTFNLPLGLKLVLFGAYTYNIIESSQYLPTSVWAHGQAYKGTKKTESFLGNAMLTYQKTIGKHFFDVIGLTELQKDIYTGYYVTVTNFNSDEFGYNNLQAGAIRPWDGTNSYYQDPHLVSFMGRFNYTYNDRYVLTFTARTDASSKFGSKHKWGFFPSLSAAWNVTKETFMRNYPQVNNLKLHAGYGLAGNQNGIDSYTSLNLVQPNGVVPVGSSNAVSLTNLLNTNPNLKWEVKHTFNAGLDVTLFDNRLYFSANYYISKTTDMLYLYNVSVPPFTYSTLLANMGSMRNSGTELSIGITPLRTKDMELNINANLTFQKNKLLSLSGTYDGQTLSAPEYKSIAGLNGAGFHGGYNNIVYQIVGHPLGVFYLPHCTGLQSDGNGGYTYGVADLSKDGNVSLEDGEDRYIAGQAVPKALLGSNISFRYKSLDVALQMNGAFGHKVYNGTSLTYMNMNSFPEYNVMDKAPAQNIKDQTVTDYWLEKGDYLNFDYLTVGWSVPLGKLQRYIYSMRLSLTVNNLATISSYSGLTPMINSSSVNSTLGVDDKRNYPLSRTYTIGLSINF